MTPEEMKVAARKELARRELTRRQQPEDYGDPVVKDGQYQVGGPVNQVNVRTEAFLEPVIGAAEVPAALASSVAAGLYSPFVGATGQALDPSNPVSGIQAEAGAREALTYQPKTESGKGGLASIASGIQAVGDFVGNQEIPFTDYKLKYFGEGERALDNASDGSPIGSPVLIDGQYQVGGPIENQVQGRVMEAYPSMASALMAYAGMPTQKTAPPIKTNVAGKDVQFKTDPWQTPQPKVTPTGRIEPILDDMGQIKVALTEGKADPRAAKWKLDAAGNVVKDPLAIAAGKTGWSDNVIQVTKTAAKNPANRIKALEMVTKTRTSLRDLEAGVNFRPESVLGDSLFARFKILKREMLSSGSKLDDVAKNTLNQSLDSTEIMANLNAKIAKFGGVVDDAGELKFPPGSMLYGPANKANRSSLKSILNQAKAFGLDQSPTGYQVHKFKQWLDDYVDFKPATPAASGKTDGFLKKWRGDINTTLRNASDEYKDINIQYSDTKGAINELGEAFGIKRLYGENAAEATGGIMRKWISNAPNRVPLMNAVQNADKIARKYGGTFDDTMESQVLMANTLNDLITKANPLTRGTFKSDIIAATSPKQVLQDRLMSAASDKVVKPVAGKLGYTDDPLKSLDAIEDLLRTP